MVPLTTFALTADEVQAKIQALLAQVAELTARIRALQSQVGTDAVVTTVTNAVANAGFKHRVCALLARNLSEGTTGDDVRGLQEFLKTEGFLSAEATGYFGALTKEALMRWQASQGVVASGDARTTGWGVLGPQTRERIKVWCGLPGQGGGWVNTERFSATPTQGAAPLSVTFSTWLSAFRVNTISYTIDFGDGTSERAADCYAPADACQSPGQNTHTYTSNGIYTATLNKITDPCPDDGDPNTPRCLAAIHQEVVGKVQVYVGTTPACTKEYKPVCGAKPIVCITTPCNPIPTTYGNRCEMNADGASFLYEGQCRSENPADDPQCRNWFDGCNSCSRNSPSDPAACTLKYCAPGTTQRPYCTARFDQSSNKPPVISGFSGPTKLAEDATGTWTIQASDPEGGTLTYQVWWGDENIYASNYTTATAAREFTQSTTFTHIYSNAGTYTVMITVRDSGGQEARSSSTVKVTSGSMPIACTADAKQCPDGSYVGRTGPNCEFVCPTTTGASCKVCTSGQFVLSGNQLVCAEPEATYANGQMYYVRCPGDSACAVDPGWSICSNGQWTNSSSNSTNASWCRATNDTTYANGSSVSACLVPGSGYSTCASYVQSMPTYTCRNGQWTNSSSNTNASCSFANTPVGSMCGGYYHCAAGVNYNYWSTSYSSECITAR